MAETDDFWAHIGLPHYKAKPGTPEHDARKRAAMAYAAMRKNGGSGYRYIDERGNICTVVFPDG